VVGVLLLVLTMAFTITGVLLPWDQNGYWATKIRLSLASSLPVLGAIIEQIALGGKALGAVTLTRFYALHVFFLPGVMILLLVFHVFQVRVKGITPPWRRVGEEENVPKPVLFYPDHLAKITLVCLAVLVGLMGYAMVREAPLEPMADPNSNFPAHTHWYFLYLFEFVHLFSGKMEFVGAVLIPSLALLAYLVLPYLDRNPERRIARRPFAVALAAGMFIGVTILGIKGARSTPREPRLTSVEQKGQKIFMDLRCQSCHGINGGGGTGGPDLASGGGKRDAQVVREVILTPTKYNPRSIMPAAKLEPGELEQLVAYVTSIQPTSVMPTEPQIGAPRPQSHRQPNFMLDHKFEVRKDAAACAECHQPRFCDSCHQKRRPDSHLHDWLPQHAGASQASGAYCQVCHSRPMCDSCHRELLHGPGWLDVHVQAGSQHAKVCAECHTQTFCSGCHQGARPASHRQPDFRHIHGTLSKTVNCAQCHGQNACASCHTKANPHPTGWEHSHGAVAQAANASCSTCHTNQRAFCDGCHKRPMPHPATFVAQHPAESKQAGANCTYCHQKQDCDGCHHSTRPASHTADWRAKHGKVAKNKQQDCLMCHRQTTCNTCHQLPMPHPAQYQAKHAADAKRSESACANCHKQSYCLQCHEKDEIHLPTARRPTESDDGRRTAAAQGAGSERDLLAQLARWQASQEQAVCPMMSRRAEPAPK
jgi:ubiquinol-cytochrome c reductase cytochrome b subunit